MGRFDIKGRVTCITVHRKHENHGKVPQGQRKLDLAALSTTLANHDTYSEIRPCIITNHAKKTS